ncbi:hypothetical protein MWN33_13295 [Starkeya koreensis]|uniref:Uncharacterized protein n=1 Tax=Ancylobacter koreensis TaxID=266121 RepID=A0ABT0DNZ8_9HYPH|nr:hypothetical protein [Ancylobacter koreensis]MCK0209006.1 hypothetical protein [Ancylobacter koreensis]
MPREDNLVDDLRNIFDDARRSSGQVQAEALLAAAPITLRGEDRVLGYMRDRLSQDSYRAICRAIGEELDRLNGEITRLRRFERMSAVVEEARSRIAAGPVLTPRAPSPTVSRPSGFIGPRLPSASRAAAGTPSGAASGTTTTAATAARIARPSAPPARPAATEVPGPAE